MKPENFTWKEVRSEGGTGAASKKHLGTFTERVVLAEMIKVEQGGQFALPHADGLQLAFVYKGEGYVNGEKLMKESAFRLGSGQQATLSSMSSLEALHLVVPAL
jgi:redox-sensitive bicupin YhaK (pirin superfamily)